MAVLPGTSLLRFKQEFIAKLQARTENVVYASPVDAQELIGEDGSGVSAFWSDDSSASIKPMVFTGGSAHYYDETAIVTLVCQAIGRTTDDTQEVVDERATNLLGQAIGVLAQSPTAGITDDTDIDFFAATPSGWSYSSGVPGDALRASRFELDIELTARLKLDS